MRHTVKVEPGDSVEIEVVEEIEDDDDVYESDDSDETDLEDDDDDEEEVILDVENLPLEVLEAEIARRKSEVPPDGETKE